MKTKTKKGLTKAGWLLFYLYIILLSYFLFFSERYGRDYIAQDFRYNLEFFKEIRRFIIYRQQIGTESFVVNILGNILAFAPFGFMLPLLNPRYRNVFRLVFSSMLFSLAVETVQLLLKVGIFDVDDLILNTAGGLLGYLCFMLGFFILRGRRPKRTAGR